MTAEETIIAIRSAMTPSAQISLLERYARLQIEKDREETIKLHLLNNGGDLANKIRERPIILD